MKSPFSVGAQRLQFAHLSPCRHLTHLLLGVQEGFTNVETAAHGLECVEKLLLFREVTLVRWKKWMELEHGEASRAQHFLTREDAEARKDDAELRKRVSMEAQVLTHALLDQVSV